MTWQECVDVVKPHVVRLTTPVGHGTGFLVHRRGDWVAVATAAHVVAHAHEWGLPIKVHWGHLDPVTVQGAGRVLLVHPERDLAVLAWGFDESVAPALPPAPLPILGDKSFVRTGVTIGWLGYPHLVEGGTRCCFFSGSVSDFTDNRYFVDGSRHPRGQRRSRVLSRQGRQHHHYWVHFRIPTQSARQRVLARSPCRR